MASVTTEDIKKIVNNFLLCAPPGEFHEVVTDVRSLLNNDNLLNEIAVETFKEYNTQQMHIVNSPNRDHKVLITKHGEVRNNTNEYLDPQGNQVIAFDHFKQEVSGSRPISTELDSDAEPWRSAIESKVLEYVRSYYDRGAGTVYASTAKSTTTVTICISSALFSGANYYNGRWRSVWTVQIAGGKANLEGTIRLQVHYYEDGNVQLNTNLTKKKKG